MKNMFKNIGPGALVAAAFIGPGTVTMCTLSGVQFGYTLLWAMVLSVIATLVLQEMAARVGIITQKGLATIIREQLQRKWIRGFVVLLILSAIVIGNAAYEAGNISGAALGVGALVEGDLLTPYIPVLIGVVAFALLFLGNYKILERGLIALVIIMSLSFLLTALITKPDLEGLFRGMTHAEMPEGSLLMVIGLIGTTVVPYNLFLHASLVKEKWKGEKDLKHARRDSMVAIILGGIVSMSIIVAAAAIQGTAVSSGADLGKALEPLYGDFATYFIGIGLFAAGITSAITAPLAAAYVANSCFGWKAGLRDFKFRLVWILILISGVVFSSLGVKPIEIIKFAQVSNGLLLPVIALFLLWVVNSKNVLGKHKNSALQNITAVIIILITIILGLKSIFKVLEQF